MKNPKRHNLVMFILAVALVSGWILIQLLSSQLNVFSRGHIVQGLDLEHSIYQDEIYLPLYEVINKKDDQDNFYTTNQIEIFDRGLKGYETNILGYLLYEDPSKTHEPLVRLINENGSFSYVTSREEYENLKYSNSGYKLDRILGYFPEIAEKLSSKLIKRTFNTDGFVFDKFYSLEPGSQDYYKDIKRPDELVGNLYSSQFTPEKIRGYDIFIVAGQSNNHHGVGLDEVKDYIGPGVYQYGRGENNKRIVPAREPLDHVGKTINDSHSKNYTGYVSSFSRHYRDNGLLESYRDVLILPVAKGNSGFSNNYWNRGDSLFTDLIRRTNELTSLSPANEIKAMFWIQGETDANAGMSQTEYEEKWLDMVGYFEKNIIGFDSETDILIGQMVPSWIKDVAEREVIDNAHKNLVDLRDNTHFVSAEDPFEIGLYDETELGYEDSSVHYSAESQRILGERFFRVYSSLKEGSI